MRGKKILHPTFREKRHGERSTKQGKRKTARRDAMFSPSLRLLTRAGERGKIRRKKVFSFSLSCRGKRGRKRTGRQERIIKIEEIDRRSSMLTRRRKRGEGPLPEGKPPKKKKKKKKPPKAKPPTQEKKPTKKAAGKTIWSRAG